MGVPLYARLERLQSRYHVDAGLTRESGLARVSAHQRSRFETEMGKALVHCVFSTLSLERWLSHPENRQHRFNTPGWNLREQFFMEDVADYFLALQDGPSPTVTPENAGYYIAERTSILAAQTRTIEHAVVLAFEAHDDAADALRVVGRGLINGAAEYMRLSGTSRHAAHHEYRDVHAAIINAKTGSLQVSRHFDAPSMRKTR